VLCFLLALFTLKLLGEAATSSQDMSALVVAGQMQNCIGQHLTKHMHTIRCLVLQGMHHRDFWHAEPGSAFNYQQQQQQEQRATGMPRQQGGPTTFRQQQQQQQRRGGAFGSEQQQQELFTMEEVEQMIERAMAEHEQQWQQWRQQQQLFTKDEVDQMIERALQQYQQQQQQRNVPPAAASLADDAAAIASASAAAAAAAAAAGPSFVPDVMARYQQPFLTQHPGLAAALGARTNVQPALQGNDTTALVDLISASCIAGARQATAEALGHKPAAAAAAAAAAATTAAAGAAAVAAGVESASGPQPVVPAPAKKVPEFKTWVSLYHLEKWYMEVGHRKMTQWMTQLTSFCV
jgi:hypothetical protein